MIPRRLSRELRLVIADKDRMHPGVMDGKVIDRARSLD
jgi:hypothetical protein